MHTARVLVFHDVEKSYDGRPVLRKVALSVPDGAHAALVGPNGAGKTTLLRLAAGLAQPDAGAVTRPADGRIAYVPQDYAVGAFRGRTVAAYLKERMGLLALEEELRGLEARLAAGEDAVMERYGQAYARFEALGGWDADARIARALEEAGLPAGMAPRDLGTLSGGEQVRVGLAAVLASRFDLYLLDEPTNNLDAGALELLEGFVAGSPATFLVVSHDRAFLDAVADSVILLDADQDGVELYGVAYTEFTQLRDQARAARMARWEAHQAEVERLRRAASAQSGAAAQVRDRRPPRDNDKFAPHFLGQRKSEQAARSKRRLEQRLARLEPVEEPHERWQLRLSLESAARSGDVVAELTDAVVQAGDFRLGPVSLHVRWGERVAVTGANGAGKSTLISLLTGARAPDAGRARIGSGVRFGVLRQGGADLTGASGLERFRRDTGWTESDARTLLAKFSLGAAHVHRPVDSYSPGERCRLGLALLSAAGANCLVLDEPTNHLDLEAVEQLEQALESFDGTLVVVSHDRRFVRTVGVGRRIVVEGGRVAADETLGESGVG